MEHPSEYITESTSEYTDSDGSSCSSETLGSSTSQSTTSDSSSYSSSPPSTPHSSGSSDQNDNGDSQSGYERSGSTSRRGVQQDQAGSQGTDNSKPKRFSKETKEESGSKGVIRRAPKRKKDEEGQEEQETDEVWYFQEEGQKVDLLSRWRWDDFKDRPVKAEVLVDYSWKDFLPHPTQFECPIRRKEVGSEVRAQHFWGEQRIFVEALCYWAISIYAHNNFVCFSSAHLKELYNQLCMFIGQYQTRPYSGDSCIQALPQAHMFGSCVEFDIKRLSNGGETCGFQAFWVELLQGRRLLVTQSFLSDILNQLNIKSGGKEVSLFREFIGGQYKYRRQQHIIARRACSYCIFNM